jgi:hypothetical protein
VREGRKGVVRAVVSDWAEARGVWRMDDSSEGSLMNEAEGDVFCLVRDPAMNRRADRGKPRERDSGSGWRGIEGWAGIKSEEGRLAGARLWLWIA